MPETILIIDDEAGVAAQMRDNLLSALPPGDRFHIDILSVEEFPGSIRVLQERRQASRQGDHVNYDPPSRFDDAAVVVIDYDLLRFDTTSVETGEAVAYVARCYSKCDIILGLNQYKPANGFDLRLRGHPDSFADVNIAGQQLSNPGLWSESHQGFRPWSWPLIPNAIDAFRQRTADLRGHLDDPILAHLAFPEEVIAGLPRSIGQFLGPRRDIDKITFREFVAASSYGLKPADEPYDDTAVARVAAARISKGLERLVLAGQEVLVDAAHLVSRFPSLLAGDKGNINTWNQTTMIAAANNDVGVNADLIQARLFARTSWLSRPAWYWNPLSNMGEIEEVSDPWKAHAPEFHFCEDLSSFCPPEATRQFVADVPSPFVRRFVIDPQSAFAQDVARGLEERGAIPGPQDFRSVTYHPEIRFSM